MATTLEVRWFVRGALPPAIRHWFELECPGDFIPTQTRTDWYGDLKRNQFTLKNILAHELDPQDFNLKFRQGNLELKLRSLEFGIDRFERTESFASVGKVEQWCKYDWLKLSDFLPFNRSPDDTYWIWVRKERAQKIYRGVKSELTQLKSGCQLWWTLALEMERDSLNDEAEQYSYFKEVVGEILQTYCGSQLSATNSYGYTRWLLEFIPHALPYLQIRADIRTENIKA